MGKMELKAEVPILRVGIFIDYKEISLKADQGLQIYEISTGKSLWTQKDNQLLKVIAESQGIKINDQSFKAKKGIRVVPIGKGYIQVEDKKYRGEIEIITEQSLLKVVNVLKLEEYLYGVLQKEIPPNWPMEVLKAQAIAARTFALFNMNKYIDQNYHICATTTSQEYGGILYEHPQTTKAVDATKGVIAVYKGKPINSVYHSDSGGYTENCEDVWGSYIPYLRSVSSEYETVVSPPNHQWTYSITEQELLTKLSQKGWQLNYIKEINITEKTATGRVKTLEILGDNGKKITLKTNDFRLLIGPNLVRSSLFTLDKKGTFSSDEKSDKIDELSKYQPTEKQEQKSVSDILKEDRDFTITELIDLLTRPKKAPENKKMNLLEDIKKEEHFSNLVFVFSGKGSGHGVGLSQWGAYGMATLGFKHEDILKYYYKGIKLAKIY
uniref:Sporulation stage II protein D amidase enhancer LytB N-terminal domain-containing protein n=1 Tax=uncultured Atribacterota bacterium TaxID=263865 RepID=G3BMR8_9BACT|nr:hypothetical protein [uncultured Atribacterota bacterium]